MLKVSKGDEIEIVVSLYGLSIGEKYKVTRVDNLGSFFFIEPTPNREYSFSYSDITNGFIHHYSTPMLMSGSSNKKDIDSLYGIYTSGDWGGWSDEDARPVVKPKTKCECGQWAIVGHEGDNWEHHSKWCEVYKEGKNNNGK